MGRRALMPAIRPALVWRIAMKILTKIAAGGVVAAALFAAAPAAAQYYPSPYGYNNYGGNVVGQVLNQVLGGGAYGGYNGYNGYGSYGVNSQAAVGQCVNAVQARLNGGNNYGYSQYGGYNGYGGGRVLGISRVESRSNGGLTIRGVANSGYAAGYGYNTNAVDLTFMSTALLAHTEITGTTERTTTAITRTTRMRLTAIAATKPR
jgi:hypothetical protein